MLYTDHEKWNDLEYKEEIGPEKTTYIDGSKIEVEKDMTPIESHKKYLEELPMREDIKKSMDYYHEIPYQGQILESNDLKDTEFVHYDLPDNLDPSKRYYAESIKAEDFLSRKCKPEIRERIEKISQKIKKQSDKNYDER